MKMWTVVGVVVVHERVQVGQLLQLAQEVVVEVAQAAQLLQMLQMDPLVHVHVVQMLVGDLMVWAGQPV